MSFTINGREFDGNRIDSTPRLGTVEEWVYVNATQMDHPMHHTNPFQIIGNDGSPEAACRDIALVKAGRQARLRVRFDDFAGKTVQHCHILDHEGGTNFPIAHEAAHFAIRYYPEAKRYYDRKASKTKPIVAIHAVAHKLARAAFHVLKGQVPFDPKRTFV